MLVVNSLKWLILHVNFVGDKFVLHLIMLIFIIDDTKPWLEKFYSINENWTSEDRRRLLAFGRDLLNSSYAGHKLTFQLFAQSAPFAHLNAVYNNFDFNGPLDFVKRSAGLSDKVMK